MMVLIILLPILLMPFKPNKIALLFSSGAKLYSDWLISIKDTLIPFEVISPIAFASFE